LDRWAANPLLVAYKAGMVTTRLEVGTAPLLLPLYNPVRLAEDAAFIQNELDGRLIVGVGAGYVDADFRHVGVALSERGPRTDEGMQVLTEAWKGEPFTFSGRHYQFDAGRCLPVPLTPPKLWLCAGGPVGVRRAARFADALVVDSIRSPQETQRLLDLYRAECDRLGRKPVAVVMRRIWIGDPDFARRQMSNATEDYREAVVQEGDAPWMPPQNVTKPSADRDEVMILGDAADAAHRLLDLAGTLGTELFILKLPFILEVPERALVLDQLAAVGDVVRRLGPRGADRDG
jgi:alkanesulfonate monooxygenase SsuD/methylene tetrahydromethanopterin reductase-like flavin-dependent oxidoreductase (luciferase family)